MGMLLSFNLGVEIFAIRRQRLRRLIDDEHAGNQAAFGEKVGIKPSQISRWLSLTTNSPRNITEKSVLLLEKKTGKPKGWFDRPAQMDRANLRLVASSSHSTDEQALIDGFRLANQETKDLMLIMAKRALENFGQRSGEQSH